MVIALRAGLRMRNDKTLVQQNIFKGFLQRSYREDKLLLLLKRCLDAAYFFDICPYSEGG